MMTCRLTIANILFYSRFSQFTLALWKVFKMLQIAMVFVIHPGLVRHQRQHPTRIRHHHERGIPEGVHDVGLFFACAPSNQRKTSTPVKGNK